ncbi:MAG: glycosyltransferase family 4 protein [Luteolibacter sp.]
MAVREISEAPSLRSELQCDLHQVISGKTQRWFTCTPVAFGGGPDFFARDSGLLCRGFQSIGCESRAVMPGERKPEDDADLIRTKFANLESAAWWKSHQLDGVVLYAWGSPRFRKVAKAIHEAGIFLVLNQDNGGLISPLAGFSGWLEEQQILSGLGQEYGSVASFLKRVLRGMTIGLLATDPLRAAHLKQGDVIACVSPAAADHYRKLCRTYGGTSLANRVKVIPHAVEPSFDFIGYAPGKVRKITSVGRWQEQIQKRPGLMRAVFQRLLGTDAEVLIEIIGERTTELESWHRSLPPGFQARVFLRGRLNRDQLAAVLRSSRIFYSPSAFESFGIAAGEALCSGCSVVAGGSASMASFEWFVSDESGTLAVPNDVEGHLAALRDELANWDQDRRNPVSISKNWSARLHADRIAAQLLAMNA